VKKKILISCALVLFLFMFSSNLMAQGTFSVDVITEKNISSYGTDYSVTFSMAGDYYLKNVKCIILTSPMNKKLFIKNELGLNNLQWQATILSEKEFIKRFPEGQYHITMLPLTYNRPVDPYISHDFPKTPTIIFPSDGAIDVPINPTIEWEDLYATDADSLMIELTGWGLGFKKDIRLWEITPSSSPAYSSYILPFNLDPGTAYTLTLTTIYMPYRELYVNGSLQNYSESSKVIRFTTGNRLE
jgi:hypothetical protein